MNVNTNQEGLIVGNPKTLTDMAAEIRELNIEKGWRSAAGGPGATWRAGASLTSPATPTSCLSWPISPRRPDTGA